jgi:hypothetical protein
VGRRNFTIYGSIILDGIIKSQKYPLSLEGRGLALWSKFQYSTG